MTAAVRVAVSRKSRRRGMVGRWAVIGDQAVSGNATVRRCAVTKWYRRPDAGQHELGSMCRAASGFVGRWWKTSAGLRGLAAAGKLCIELAPTFRIIAVRDPATRRRLDGPAQLRRTGRAARQEGGPVLCAGRPGSRGQWCDHDAHAINGEPCSTSVWPGTGATQQGRAGEPCDGCQGRGGGGPHAFIRSVSRGAEYALGGAPRGGAALTGGCALGSGIWVGGFGSLVSGQPASSSAPRMQMAVKRCFKASPFTNRQGL